MKANFKPLGLAAAVAAATAGYAGVVNAQSVANNGLGDLALVPYYTTRGDFGTGVHVINTSDRTQVVKLRFRRGSDSLDAMDFNLIMSPYDEWTGFLSEDGSGDISMSTQDTTCTSPIFSNGKFPLADIWRDGAEEGYIEVIGMGSPSTETSAVARFAKHAPGAAPANCSFVDQNFLDAYLGSTSDPRGIHSSSVSAGPDLDAAGNPTLGITEYVDTGDVLKVSWFIRNSEQGVEFGNDAVHIAGFADEAMMSHQEAGKFSGNLRGFDFPDLETSAPFVDTTIPLWIAHEPTFPSAVIPGAPATPIGAGWVVQDDKYNSLRAGDVLGVSAVLNDWSNNGDLNVGTDWIITIPGQYNMLNQPKYFPSLGSPGGVIGEGVDANGDPVVCGSDCDFRDLPVVAEFRAWDREENEATPPPGDRGTVISPSPPGAIVPSTLLRYEVNVIHWGEPVLDSQYDETDVSAFTELLLPATSGWAQLGISSRTDALGASVQQICRWDGDYFNTATNLPGGATYDPNAPMDCTNTAEGNAPMIGFVAWQRSFPQNPDGNYGRAVNHSFESGVAPPPPIVTP